MAAAAGEMQAIGSGASRDKHGRSGPDDERATAGSGFGVGARGGAAGRGTPSSIRRSARRRKLFQNQFVQTLNAAQTLLRRNRGGQHGRHAVASDTSPATSQRISR